MNGRADRLDEAQAVEQAARDHALRAFETARVKYHGHLRSRGYKAGFRMASIGRGLASDLDTAESECLRLGLDPWGPGVQARLRQLSSS